MIRQYSNSPTGLKKLQDSFQSVPELVLFIVHDHSQGLKYASGIFDSPAGWEEPANGRGQFSCRFRRAF
jgi:hypothetical protein